VTEIIVTTRLRAKPFTWEYKQYKLVEAGGFSRSESPDDTWTWNNQTIQLPVGSKDTSYDIYNTNMRAESFKLPTTYSTWRIKEIYVYLQEKYPPQHPNACYIQLWNCDSSGKPTSKITEINVGNNISNAQFYGGALPTTVTKSGGDWIAVVVYAPAYSASYAVSAYTLSDQDANYCAYKSTDGGNTWTAETGEITAKIVIAWPSKTVTDSFSFPESHPLAVKRLDYSVSGPITSISVNNTNVGTSLTKTMNIPQSTSYNVSFTVQGGSYSITRNGRYLYFNKSVATPEDFGISEAYLQKVTYLEDGSVLRINDDINMDLMGSANTTDVFTDVLVPWRKLEWKAGSGRIIALGVE